jgi:hypothetical protein
VSVEDDAEQGSASGLTGSVGQGWVVGEDGADAGENGVGGVAEALDFFSGLGTGEPVRLVGSAGLLGGSEIAVDREGGFEGDEGSVMLDEVGEGVVEVAGWLLKDSEGDFDPGGAESSDALAADLRVRVFGGDDDSCDARCYKGVGAGASSSVMGTGLEGDVSGRSGWINAAFMGLLEGGDLGVVAVGVEMRAFCDDLVVSDEDAAYLRIR